MNSLRSYFSFLVGGASAICLSSFKKPFSLTSWCSLGLGFCRLGLLMLSGVSAVVQINPEGGNSLLPAGVFGVVGKENEHCVYRVNASVVSNYGGDRHREIIPRDKFQFAVTDRWNDDGNFGLFVWPYHFSARRGIGPNGSFLAHVEDACPRFVKRQMGNYATTGDMPIIFNGYIETIRSFNGFADRKVDALSIFKTPICNARGVNNCGGLLFNLTKGAIGEYGQRTSNEKGTKFNTGSKPPLPILAVATLVVGAVLTAVGWIMFRMDYVHNAKTFSVNIVVLFGDFVLFMLGVYTLISH